jgi:DNA polymerase-3 subunit epsilon/ATP-dependent DNA helicase DinG
MNSMIALDIETTGLDAHRDAILEIAAVRFNGRRIEDQWSSLINPNRPIPGMITQLTGITNEMVRNAPPIKAILHELADFVGNLPIVGHNVRFDLGFLRNQGLFEDNQPIDTYELAAVLMPTASRYNLGSLGQLLNILIPNSHRALDDARLAHAVFIELYEKAQQIPIELLAEIVRQGADLDWDGHWAFQQVLRERSRQPIGPRRVAHTDYGALFGTPWFDEPLTPRDPPQPLNPDEVSALLEYGGPFSHYFEGYEYRPQQVEMLRHITQAFSEGYHLLVEAGTGTGKSFAYLTPAALWAIQNGLRVVITTNTIALQEQLINKDIPDLAAALNLNLRATVLKGRSNYLCPRRFEALRQRGPQTAEEARMLGKILVWLNEGGQGDRSEINLNGPQERQIWNSLSADDEGCKAEVCISRTGGACPFYRAHQAAQNAHLLIVNHALLLADAVTGNRILPDYQYLIVDEAHHIEDASTNALSYRITQSDLQRLLRELGSTSSGILGRLFSILRGLLRPSELAAIEQILSRITDLAFRLDFDLLQFFRAIEEFLSAQREGQPLGTYSQQERILPSTRNQPDWMTVELQWEAAHETLKLMLNPISELHKQFGEQVEDEELQDVLNNLATVHRQLSEAQSGITALVSQPDPSFIYWIEIQPNGGRVALNIAPLHIGPLMEEYLWHQKTSVILTSATLTTSGEFDYLRNRLNADEADELMVGSPFDYENSALLYLVNDIPEPSDSSYQRAVEQALVQLSKATQGRILALFTSYAQLKRTSSAIHPPWPTLALKSTNKAKAPRPICCWKTFVTPKKPSCLARAPFGKVSILPVKHSRL